VRFCFIKTLFWTRIWTLYVIWIDRYVISLRPRCFTWPAASRVLHVPFGFTCNRITCPPASHVTSRIVAVHVIFLFIFLFVWFPVNACSHDVDLVFRQRYPKSAIPRHVSPRCSTWCILRLLPQTPDRKYKRLVATLPKHTGNVGWTKLLNYRPSGRTRTELPPGRTISFGFVRSLLIINTAICWQHHCASRMRTNKCKQSYFNNYK